MLLTLTVVFIATTMFITGYFIGLRVGGDKKNPIPFMAFIGFEKERHLMGRSVFGLQTISEFSHRRPARSRGMRNFQFLEKNTLADLARVFKAQTIIREDMGI